MIACGSHTRAPRPRFSRWRRRASAAAGRCAV